MLQNCGEGQKALASTWAGFTVNVVIEGYCLLPTGSDDDDSSDNTDNSGTDNDDDSSDNSGAGGAGGDGGGDPTVNGDVTNRQLQDALGDGYWFSYENGPRCESLGSGMSTDRIVYKCPDS